MRVEVESISQERAEELGVFEWPVWQRGISRFIWQYDATEVCYLVAGRARIETEDGNVEVESGDLLTLPDGLACTWDIREPIRKHYRIVAE